MHLKIYISLWHTWGTPCTRIYKFSWCSAQQWGGWVFSRVWMRVYEDLQGGSRICLGQVILLSAWQGLEPPSPPPQHSHYILPFYWTFIYTTWGFRQQHPIFLAGPLFPLRKYGLACLLSSGMSQSLWNSFPFSLFSIISYSFPVISTVYFLKILYSLPVTPTSIIHNLFQLLLFPLIPTCFMLLLLPYYSYSIPVTPTSYYSYSFPVTPTAYNS